MTIPVEPLSGRFGPVAISGPVSPAINLITIHCGIPIAGPLAATNTSGAPWPSFILDGELQTLSAACRFEVPSLGPGQRVDLGCLEFRPQVDSLRRIMAAQPECLVLRHRAGTDEILRHDLHVLGSREWICQGAARRTIAAFVNPSDAAVQAVVSAAKARLQSLAGTSSYVQLLAAPSAEAAKIAAAALYDTLLEARAIHYTNPKLNLAPVTSQTVRPPGEVLGDSPAAQGTCLDLSVALASCLENVGLRPVIVFCLDAAQSPFHAMCGCWSGPASGSRSLITDAADLRRHIERGHLHVIECTGFCAGAGQKLDFRQAIERAQSTLQRAPGVFAVDIGACRPPFGNITPVDWPYQPDALACLAHALQLAAAKRARVLETTHLFAGLLAARGRVTCFLAAEANLDIDRICRGIDDLLAAGTSAYDGSAAEGRNFSECRHLAEVLAWQAGSPCVGERDLWWAVLTKFSSIPKLQIVCRRLAIDMDMLITAMQRQYPCPRVWETPSFPSSLPAT